MSYWLFLDDERYPPTQWTTPTLICRNYDEFVRALLYSGMPEFISFDHDLGSTSIYDAYAVGLDSLNKDKTGYDCAKYLVEWLMDHDRNDFICFTTHSANPVGAANISNLLNNWNNKGRVS